MADQKSTNPPVEKIVVKNMEEVMHESMMPYSEYVILDRALPRVEDGLKPVQRRILYTMSELGLRPDTPHRKCARIVGDCLGKYHPHGDTSVYGALARMAQPFNMREPLVDGQGNFGSIDGDGPAAMRYTEARMAPLALELLRDIDKGTIRWSCNFDDTLQEPDILPGRFPNLLVNGANGIAVGLATNIPPHNLGEAIDAVCLFITNPRVKLSEMMKTIKGPDFPGGGTVIGGEELYNAYDTGRGKITMRAKLHIEAGDGDKKLIVIDELPYQVNKAALLESILKVKDDKKDQYPALSDIIDIRDESDRLGMRAIIFVKKDGNPKKIIDLLFKYTQLSTTFGINMVAIANGKPQQMGLLDIIAYYADTQRDVIVKRTKFDLEASKKREQILSGLIIAVQNIDEVIQIIKTSDSTPKAKERLRERFTLTDAQAQAILDLRLARLTHLEVYKLEQELIDIRNKISELTAILGSKKLQWDTIRTELLQIKRQYKSQRKTEILNDEKHYVIQDLSQGKPKEDCVVAVNAHGDIKKMLVKNFTMAQKDFSESTTKKEICTSVIKLNSDEIFFGFTNLGNCYKIDYEQLPEGKWKEAGQPLKKIFPGAEENERIIFATSYKDKLPQKGNLLFYTKLGMIKKTPWSEYTVTKTSFQACKLNPDDEVICVEEERKDATLMFVTALGLTLNAEMSDIPIQHRISAGVKGIQLADNDYCVLIKQVSPSDIITLVTDRSFGKKVAVKDIDVMARYRKGIKIIDLTKTKPNNGTKLLYAAVMNEPCKIVLVDYDGFLTSVDSETIKKENRTHSGSALIKGSMPASEVYRYLNDYCPGV